MCHNRFVDIPRILLTDQKPFWDKVISSSWYMIYQLHLSSGIRQGNSCNNLATRVIPLILSKSAVAGKFLKTLLPIFLRTLLSRYQWNHSLQSPLFFFPTMPKFRFLFVYRTILNKTQWLQNAGKMRCTRHTKYYEITW